MDEQFLQYKARSSAIRLPLAILKIAQCVYPKRTSIKGIRYLLTMKFEQEIGKIFSLLNADNLENTNM